MEELIKEWIAEFNKQNEALSVFEGEETLTVEEFISCRIDDARNARSDKAAAHKREWWRTYRAALTGFAACSLETDELHDQARASAETAHGPLEHKP